MQFVLRRKSDPRDNRLAFDRVHSFLRTYWRFAQSQRFIPTDRSFPTHKVFELRRVYLARAGDELSDSTPSSAPRLQLDDFLELFFLFDNQTPDTTCVHGERSRVAVATEQLASQVHPELPFDRSLFDELFERIVSDDSGNLSCRQVDLLYYLYSARAILRSNVAAECPMVEAASGLSQQAVEAQ
eukprot:TRINITY_DN1768_c0_g1_i1.p1 TRINITY_DN1768_c0_g1~~TRINITY_DN1768_c0_g1_i1.p1  ORF type:complete len:185 (-),score=46.64 TRINITY_DN1768_c0_g1_i1:31-585(-)